MNIKGDQGKPWRYNKLIEYIVDFPDELTPVVKGFLKREKATKSDVVWWVLLYSSCYCVATACVMYKNLDFRTLTHNELEEFWEDNKQKLIFQSDRRYIKNMNQFVEIVEEFLKNSGRNPWGYLKKFIKNDEKATYESMYKEVNSWKYYGRFGTILFMYNINKLLKIPMNNNSYDWKNGSTTTEAIFNANYMDKRAEIFKNNPALTSKDINHLNKTLEKIIDDLNKISPERNWTILGVTSDMCSYRKLFKSTRYLGYYVDRQQEEILQLQKNYPEYNSMWDYMWEDRKNGIDEKYLGEKNGYVGIQKSRMSAWVERGEFR